VAVVSLDLNEMLQLRDSASPRVKKGTRHTGRLCNLLSRKFQSVAIMIRSVSELETEQTWHKSFRHFSITSRQPIARHKRRSVSLEARLAPTGGLKGPIR
jgi:hypothetical protein